MTAVTAVSSLLLGLAYTWLGTLVFFELREGRHVRGLSPFGVAFMFMAFTCGPHHLVHFEHAIFGGAPTDALTAVALLMGLPAGLAVRLAAASSRCAAAAATASSPARPAGWRCCRSSACWPRAS